MGEGAALRKPETNLSHQSAHPACRRVKHTHCLTVLGVVCLCAVLSAGKSVAFDTLTHLALAKSDTVVQEARGKVREAFPDARFHMAAYEAGAMAPDQLTFPPGEPEDKCIGQAYFHRLDFAEKLWLRALDRQDPVLACHALGWVVHIASDNAFTASHNEYCGLNLNSGVLLRFCLLVISWEKGSRWGLDPSPGSALLRTASERALFTNSQFAADIEAVYEGCPAEWLPDGGEESAVCSGKMDLPDLSGRAQRLKFQLVFGLPAYLAARAADKAWAARLSDVPVWVPLHVESLPGTLTFSADKSYTSLLEENGRRLLGWLNDVKSIASGDSGVESSSFLEDVRLTGGCDESVFNNTLGDVLKAYTEGDENTEGARARARARIAALPVRLEGETGAGMLDCVFCIDNSGSMRDDIQALQASLAALMAALKDYAAAENISLHTGLVSYTRHDEPDWLEASPLSGNVDRTAGQIDAIEFSDLTGGGRGNEDMLAALMAAMDQPVGGSRLRMGWRQGAAKIIIAMGDEPADDPDWEDRTVDDVARVARNLDPVHIYPLLSPKQGGFFLNPAIRSMERIADATDGEIVRVESVEDMPDRLLATVRLAVRQHRNEVWRQKNPPYTLYAVLGVLIGGAVVVITGSLIVKGVRAGAR